MADCYEVTNMESHRRGDVKGKTSLAMGALRLLEQWFTERLATVREIATQHVWMTAQVRTHMRGKHSCFKDANSEYGMTEASGWGGVGWKVPLDALSGQRLQL